MGIVRPVRAVQVVLLLAIVLVLPLLGQTPIADPPITGGGTVVVVPPWAPLPHLLIHEISPRPGGGEAAWLELYNPSGREVALEGVRLVAGPPPVQEIVLAPDPGTVVAARGFAVVAFSLGAGAGAPPSVPGGAILVEEDVGFLGPWRPTHGELAVSVRDATAAGGERLADYVAWGRRGGIMDQARLRVWPAPWYVHLAESFGAYDPATEIAPRAAIGRQPATSRGTPSTWAPYDRDERTPGAANAWPRPKLFSLASGLVIVGPRVEISWRGRGPDLSYEFVLRRADGTVVDGGATTTPRFVATSLTPGGYRFAVRLGAGEHLAPPGSAPGTLTTPLPAEYGAWSRPLRFSVASFSSPPRGPWFGPNPGSWGEIGTMSHLVQRKDTGLLCLEQCTGTAWNVPAPVGAVDDHGASYCVMASSAMMASAYGGALSQDRIAYQVYHAQPGNIVDCELGHNAGVEVELGSDGGIVTTLLEWALGASSGTSSQHIVFVSGPGDFPSIRKWIDDGRPIMALRPGHVMAVGGYAIVPSPAGPDRELIRLHNPLASTASTVEYGSWAPAIKALWIGPVPPEPSPDQQATVRSDEADVAADSDGDGITDFDERYRLGTEWSHETDRRPRDTDRDGVHDLQDLRSYVLAADGSCIAYTGVHTPDFDGDGRRKERDVDNDGDCCPDGNEDLDRDGYHDPADGETSCFAADCDAPFMCCASCGGQPTW